MNYNNASIAAAADDKKNGFAGHGELPGTEGGYEDDMVLRELGYAQELPRTKTFFNMWMMTIVLSSIPYGLSTTFFYTLGNGGAMVAIWDFIIMSCIYVCVAVSLGEIASQYPVSGGVYYWSYMLSPTKLKPLVSWIVGWLSVVGNITVTLAVNFAIIVLGIIAILGQHFLHYVDPTQADDPLLTSSPNSSTWVLDGHEECATGMLPAMAEEAIKPETTIPRAMVWGVVVNGTLGLIFLLSIMFTLGDLETILASPTGQPLPEIFLEATGTHAAAFGLFFLSKFARDGGIPGRGFFGKTSKRLEMPLNGFLLQSIIQCALACIYFGSTAAFNAFLGVSVLSLGGACFVPILVSFLRGRKLITGAKYYKGKFGFFCNCVSIAWFLLAIPILSFPSYLPVTQENMNYAAVVFVGFASLSCIWYIIHGRKHYSGPPDGHTGL
ncbi:uncharacterized protein IL334_000407 [Kwoniella shivajii]|uniref:Amino acid permease n=1 Tax=Kwoniella shivajii TaxID=564305 RepID=A0ABZ1CP30_9TREE|nr:hypothetical protein IL334_000407 [Kwoniella shivajii]